MESPSCDASSHECRACGSDVDCGSTLCDLDSGRCIAEASLLYASPTGSGTATCAKADPGSIAEAFAIADVARDTIKLASGGYTANLTINNKAITLYGFGATVSSSAGNAFTVNDHASLKLVGLSIVATGAGAYGVLCRSNNGIDVPSITLVQATVNTTATAVFGVQCTVAISRSTLQVPTDQSVFGVIASTTPGTIDRTKLDGGGVFSLQGATVHVTNSLIMSASSTDGAFVGNSGSIIVSFSTVINSPVSCGTGSAVCSGSSPNGVCIDNSIILNTVPGAPSDTVTGTRCFGTFDLVFPQTTALSGTGNRYADPMLSAPSSGDYHLKAGSPAIDSADPAALDAIDFDGTTRPQGMRNDIGAFEYKP